VRSPEPSARLVPARPPSSPGAAGSRLTHSAALYPVRRPRCREGRKRSEAGSAEPRNLGTDGPASNPSEPGEDSLLEAASLVLETARFFSVARFSRGPRRPPGSPHVERLLTRPAQERCFYEACAAQSPGQAAGTTSMIPSSRPMRWDSNHPSGAGCSRRSEGRGRRHRRERAQVLQVVPHLHLAIATASASPCLRPPRRATVRTGRWRRRLPPSRAPTSSLTGAHPLCPSTPPSRRVVARRTAAVLPDTNTSRLVPPRPTRR
jgi:hypothetical protein